MANWAWWPQKVSGTPPNVAQTMTDWGVPNWYDSADPSAPLYKAIVPMCNPGLSFAKTAKYGYGHATWTPGGFQGDASGNGAWEVFCEMCLRARTLFYAEETLGDCGIQFAASGPSTADILGTQAAETAANFIPIPGLGAIIGDIGGLLSGAAHQKAVLTEKQVLCQLTQQVGGLIQQIYESYYGGAITGAQALAEMKQLAVTFHGSYVEASVADKQCNAGCGMDGIMAAHVALAGYLFEQVPLPAGVAIAFPSTSTEVQASATAPLVAITVVPSLESSGASASEAPAAVISSSGGLSLGLLAAIGFLIVLFMVIQ